MFLQTVAKRSFCQEKRISDCLCRWTRPARDPSGSRFMRRILRPGHECWHSSLVGKRMLMHSSEPLNFLLQLGQCICYVHMQQQP